MEGSVNPDSMGCQIDCAVVLVFACSRTRLVQSSTAAQRLVYLPYFVRAVQRKGIQFVWDMVWPE